MEWQTNQTVPFSGQLQSVCHLSTNLMANSEDPDQTAPI